MARYDAISFVPPRGVRAACARGIALHEQGHSGDGLQPETVAWARRMARGEAVSPEKATKMNAWFARHATSPGEAEARRRDKKSPAWVAWLLWGGDAGRRWARRLVRQMANADKRARAREASLHQGAQGAHALQYGACVELSVPPTDAEGGPWSTIAYEAELKGYRLASGGHARITSKDIDEMVANFARYPKAPIVVEHADTREGMPAEWAVPRGHVVALRRGTFARTMPDGTSKTVASLDARFDVSPEVRLTIVGDPANGIPPTWPFCSITTAAGVDPETGASLGTVLWSVSLTAHPRLTDLPRLAASQTPTGETMERETARDTREHGYWHGEIKTRGDVVAMLRAIFELPVMASEAEVVAGLARVESLLGVDDDTSGVDVDDLIGSMRRALGLDALKTATEVIAAAREALRVMPATEGGDPPATASTASTPTTETASKPDAEMSRGHTAANPPKEGKSMSKILEMAADLKLPAATEEATLVAIQSLARDGAAVRATLGLAADAPLAPAVADLVTARAELAKLSPELTALRAEKAEREAVELSRRVDEVCVARGYGEDVKPALLALARSDRKAFDEKFPAPSVQELAQRAQDGERTKTIVRDDASASAAKTSDPGVRANVKQGAESLRAVAAEFGLALSTLEALEMLQRGATPDSLRVELTKRAG